MKKWKIVLCGLLLANCLTGCGETETSVTEVTNTKESNVTAQTTDINIQTEKVPATSYEALQQLSYNLFAENMQEENPVLSPTSAYMAVSLAGTGAQGETLEQMQAVLGKDLYSLPQELMHTMPLNEDGLTVSIANSAWIDDEFHVTEQWMKDAGEYYQAEAVHTDLKTEETMNNMNAWVEDKTEGMIKKFLQAPFSDDTKLVLFNTIYFNGKWAVPFKAESTEKKDFTNTSGNVVQADMMRAFGKYFDYFNGDLADGVVLPYKEDAYSFVAMKPKEDMTVREMYAQMSMEDITGLIDSKEDIKMNLLLPKFEVSFDKNLNESFMNLGMVRAFDSERAEFQNIGFSSRGLPLYINLIRQKAVVRVDEEGTEAAAVTMVVMNELTCARTEPPIDVFFDEPFLYMIWDNENDLPLFVGIMDDPTTAKTQ